jgi:hypothetical protein
MENSVLIAKILGPYCVIVAIGLMFNLKFYQRMIEDFFKNAALIYLGGIMALIIGIVIVLSHNVWVAGWPIIITIFGWGGLIKGIWLIVFPNSVGKITQLYQKKPALLRIHMIIILVIGLFLSAKGYFA